MLNMPGTKTPCVGRL